MNRRIEEMRDEKSCTGLLGKKEKFWVEKSTIEVVTGLGRKKREEKKEAGLSLFLSPNSPRPNLKLLSTPEPRQRRIR
jgi:hypothetical protein